jgi:hypothetical protein
MVPTKMRCLIITKYWPVGEPVLIAEASCQKLHCQRTCDELQYPHNAKHAFTLCHIKFRDIYAYEPGKCSSLTKDLSVGEK